MPTYQDESMPAQGASRAYTDAYDSLVAILNGGRFTGQRRVHFRFSSLTLSLLLVFVLYSFTVAVNLAALLDVHGTTKIQTVYPGVPSWAVPVTTVLAALMVAAVTSMLYRKKSGFYILLVTAFAMAAVQFIAAGSLETTALSQFGYCLIPMFWPLLLFVLIRASGPRSAWSQFE